MIQLNSIKKKLIYIPIVKISKVFHILRLYEVIQPILVVFLQPINDNLTIQKMISGTSVTRTVFDLNHLSQTCFSLTNGFRWKHYTSYIIARLCKLRSQLWLLSSRKVHITFISFLGEWLFTWQASMMFKNMKSEFFTS